MSITQTCFTKHPNAWQIALKSLITTPEELLSLLELTSDQVDWAQNQDFSLRVSQSFVRRMKKKDPYDPLLRQILPSKKESQLTVGYDRDPLKERERNPIPGLLHKFHGRVLLTPTQSCAIHCRYCFRRYFPYQENRLSLQHWSAIIEYIQSDLSIHEVIFSGGDPLMLSDKKLAEYLADLEAIPHLRVIRFHTRFPVLIPERITETLASLLARSRLTTIMVYHINHPQELCEDIKTGVRLLQAHGISVLNQSVLLKDINDSAATLIELSWRLIQTGILPYYVHMLDKVQGAHHFAVCLETAKTLERAIRAELPGYLVPRFVQEIPGATSKIAI